MPLPVMLEVDQRRCVLIGGGAVATRRGQALHAAGARIVVVAPAVTDTLAAAAAECHRRVYAEGDLRGAFLVVTAADDAAANRAAAEEAARLGVLVNRADAGPAGDLTFMATARVGTATLAVDSGVTHPRAARAIRDRAAAAVDAAWVASLAAEARPNASGATQPAGPREAEA